MKLAIFTFNSDYCIRPDDLARACEERGYESLWFGEHSHIPTSRKTPYPGGGDLPDEYLHMRDPFVSLTAAAMVTKNLKLGTGICLVVERDPLMLAKEVATIDEVSNGRFLFGIGGGWNAEEMENHGTPFKKRWKILKERVEAMKALWTQEEAEYHGEFVDFDPVWSYPKPVQKPHPPIIMGSATAKGRERVVDYCDGWIPIDMMIEDLPAAVKDLHAKAEAAGRDPKSIEISIFSPRKPTRDHLDQYAELGVERIVLFAPQGMADEVLPFLDEMAPLAAKAA